MAHKTLIGGTAYEINGGKTLIGGTAYEIDKGKTLVGGTVYKVGFGVFTLVYDVGTFKATNASSTGYNFYATWNIAALPDGWGKCNRLIYDGVEYELEVTNGGADTYFINYTPIGRTDILIVFMNMFGCKIDIYTNDQNTHTAQIGYFE
jgi:hypothetical protein